MTIWIPPNVAWSTETELGEVATHRARESHLRPARGPVSPKRTASLRYSCRFLAACSHGSGDHCAWRPDNPTADALTYTHPYLVPPPQS